MDWFWEVLGIQPTKEVHEIKKAYVERMRTLKAKEIHGEVNQNMYHKLEQAEKLAVAYADRVDDEQKGIVDNGAMPINSSNTLQEASKSEVHVQHTSELKEKTAVKETSKEGENFFDEFDWQQAAQTVAENESSLPPSEVVKRHVEATQSKSAETVATIATSVYHLLDDWQRRNDIKEWEAIFFDFKKCTISETKEVRDLMEPILEAQLIYLPKPILFFLIDVLSLENVECKNGERLESRIDELPDFSFLLLEEIPNNQAYTYFKKRYEFYELIFSKEWKTQTFEIEKMIDFYRDAEDTYLFDPIEIDLDIRNLCAVYCIKDNIKELTVRNASSHFVEEYLVPSTLDLKKLSNRTSKFLRILFTAINNKVISLEESLYIEKQENSYIEENLREFLIGCVFFHTRDRVKADKHFYLISDEYRALAKPMMSRAQTVTTNRNLPKDRKRPPTPKKQEQSWLSKWMK